MAVAIHSNCLYMNFLQASKIPTILNTLGHNFVDEELQALIEGHDPESK